LEIEERCRPRKCLKEVNPEEFPGVYLGTPGKYDPNWGACWDCEKLYTEGGSIPDPNRVWNPPSNDKVSTGEWNLMVRAIQTKPLLILKKRVKSPKANTLSEICRLEEEVAKLEKEIKEEERNG
jgi:hypothetical protein